MRFLSWKWVTGLLSSFRPISGAGCVAWQIVTNSDVATFGNLSGLGTRKSSRTIQFTSALATICRELVHSCCTEMREGLCGNQLWWLYQPIPFWVLGFQLPSMRRNRSAWLRNSIMNSLLGQPDFCFQFFQRATTVKKTMLLWIPILSRTWWMRFALIYGACMTTG